jgi:hypothetical protein
MLDETEEEAGGILVRLSEKSSFMTDEILAANGGWL